MREVSKEFKVVIPAELVKSEDGEWIVKGLASTPSKDAQGEVLLPDGIDATPIDQGRGVLNWDHQKGPENTVGLLDSYSRTKEGFFVKGRLFKNHSKAKSIHEIMSSLGKSDQGRMGLSVEGKILERAGKDGKIIKKCQIHAVALTMNPVNQDSYVDLVKSFSDEEVEFQATEENSAKATETTEPMFTSTQVMQLIQKALGVSDGGAKPPTERSGGDALAVEDMDKKPKSIAEANQKSPAKLKKMTRDMCKSHINEIMDKMQTLYPTASKDELWGAVKERLHKRFPDLQQNDE